MMAAVYKCDRPSLGSGLLFSVLVFLPFDTVSAVSEAVHLSTYDPASILEVPGRSSRAALESHGKATTFSKEHA